MKLFIVIFILSGLYFFTGLNAEKRFFNNAPDRIRKIPAANQPKDFINLIFNWGYDPADTTKWVLSNLSRYKDSLKFNAVHMYGSNELRYGESGIDLTEKQVANVKDLMDKITSADLKGVYERYKLSSLCWGQSVVYEVAQSTGSSSVNNGFCYTQRDNNSASYITDNGLTVLYSSAASDKAGWIAKNIYENVQHSDIFQWQWNDAVDWHIKPMMRIKTSDFKSSGEALVAAVVTRNFSNQTIDSTLIRVKNFGDSTGNYSGMYTDIYKDLKLKVIGGMKNPNQLNYGIPSTEGMSTQNDSVDFRVYWFGKIDMWFDKMTVENEAAERVLKGDFDKEMDEELTNFANYSRGTYMFFTDEITYSNMPCVKHVYDYIRSRSPGTKFSCALTNFNNIRGMRNYDKNAPLSFKKYFEEMRPDVFTVDAHQINWGSYLPQSFISSKPDADKRLNASWLKSDADYNDFLQKKVLGDAGDASGRTPAGNFKFPDNAIKPSPEGSFIYQVCLARRLSDEFSPGAQMIVQPQLHCYVVDENTAAGLSKFDQYGNREATNEEIQVQAMTAIAQGADGLCWFIYGSISWKDGNKNNYHYGLTEPNSSAPRYFNMYGQNKWEYIKSMNEKILNWKPVLDKINWESGYSMHSEGAKHNFVTDIKSLYRNSSNEYSNEDAVKYWEMGFFNPSDPNEKSKYFMLVNRRCVPETSVGTGDLRQLKIKFNAVNLSGFDKWKIVDLNTNQTILTINKNSSEYYNMGVFNPGEGKLYKLEPVN